eukprot:6466020-Amphidinium_carterae.1
MPAATKPSYIRSLFAAVLVSSHTASSKRRLCETSSYADVMSMNARATDLLVSCARAMYCWHVTSG